MPPHLTSLAIILLKLGALGVLFYFMEKIRPAEKETPYFKKEFGTELVYAIVNPALFSPLLTAAAAYLSHNLLTMLIPYQFLDGAIQSWPLALQVLFGALVIDFAVYWRHRLSHRYWWPFHAVHHSAEQISWLTKNRLHPVDLASAILFNVLMLHLLGFSGPGIFLAFALVEAVDYFAHLNLDFEFKGPMRYLINTPNYHRWHHANQKEAYDKNFVAVFPFIDLIFGTYHFPRNQLPKAYGISPAEQKDCPADYTGQFLYPFRRLWRKCTQPRKQ